MDKYLGHATAFGYAKSKGYTGTEEEFAELMASYATVAESAAASAESATESATTAGAAKDAAVAAKTAAETASGTATTKASEASASATSAASSATTAEAASTTATVKASEASTSAQTASDKALEASTSATAAGTAQTAAETAQTAAEDAADRAETAAQTFTTDTTLTIAGKAADAKATGDKIRNALPLETASGAVASFPDGSDLFPAEECKVSIEPVQDLNGYDSPWPAGGGKNLLDKTLMGNVDATMRTVNLQLKPNTQYTASTSLPLTSGTTANFFFHLPGESESTNTNGVSSNIPRTITTGADGVAVVAYRRGTYTAQEWLSYDYQVEEGSTATSYAPYSNVCPISGWDGVEINACGMNVWDEEWEVGSLNGAGVAYTDLTAIRSKNFIPVVKGEKYYFKTSYALKVRLYDRSKVFVSAPAWPQNNEYELTAPDGVAYVRFATQSNYGNVYKDDIAINYPSTDHDYHAYTGSTISVIFPSEVGTVYGGTLDLVSGELVVDRAMVDLGTLTYSYDATNRNFQTSSFVIKPGAARADSILVCTQFAGKPYGYNGSYPDEDGIIWPHTGGTLRIHDFAYTDATAFKTAMSGVMLVYPVTTSTTYHLTPQEVSILLGYNNIWADCGDTEVKYRADVQRYIEKKLAEIEALILEN